MVIIMSLNYCTGSSISTRELNTLKWKDPSGKDRVLKLKDEMSAEWFKIGSTVGFTDAKLKVIKTSHMNEGEGCMNEVIRLWIQKMPEEVIILGIWSLYIGD